MGNFKILLKCSFICVVRFCSSVGFLVVCGLALIAWFHRLYLLITYYTAARLASFLSYSWALALAVLLLSFLAQWALYKTE